MALHRPEPGRVTLTGPATFVATIEVPCPLSNPYQEALGATLIERSVRERIVLVGVTFPGSDDETTAASLDELSALIDTAGADEVGRMVQRRDHPDHTWFIGKGKATELHELCLEVDADTVVFDNELSPAQQYNLEKLLGRTAIDRTAVILDIFAQNAHTLEGKAQVELALLRYRLPRLRRGADAKLSQQRGGVGTRFGGGETKLEVDRRRIKRRISRLESELEELGRTRQLQRQQRDRSGLGAVTIVGYTNAGKSTLLNTLTDAGVLTENRLFATLDPTTRRLSLPGGEPVLLTDTVGFVRRLPHGLVESFKSTLEVASRADYLVHVVDASDVDPQGQIDAVREVLTEIDADAVPELLVFNKADLAPLEAKRLVADHPGSVAVSAVTGEGIEDFLRVLSDRLRSISTIVELEVPYDRGDVLAAIHREGEVVSSTDERRPDARPGPAVRRLGRPAGRVRRRVERVVNGPSRAGASVRPPALPVRPAGTADAGGRRVRRGSGRPVDRDADGPAAGGRRRGVLDVGHRAGLSAEHRLGRVPGRRVPLDRATLRRRGPDRRHRRLHRQQGVRRHAAAVAAAAHARPRHRAVPGDVVPDLRDGGHPRRVPAGRRADAPVGRRRPGARSIPPMPTGRSPCGSTARATRPAASTTSARSPPGAGPTACPCSPTSATSSSRGTARAAASSSTGSTGVVAVHSLSKRSNLAGGRVGFYAGDPELVHYLQEVRKHVGMMVPGPAQAAGVVALDDDAHVEVQRRRYHHRLERMAEILGAWTGRPIALPAGGFYLWFPVDDGWAFAERLAAEGGAIVSPGEFYGVGAEDHVRVAVVQPDERIELVAERLGV